MVQVVKGLASPQVVLRVYFAVAKALASPPPSLPVPAAPSSPISSGTPP
jgi:hypothetical protein